MLVIWGLSVSCILELPCFSSALREFELDPFEAAILADVDTLE